MKVLMINTGYFPVPPLSATSLVGGSIELHTYYLSNELARLGIEVHYVTNVTSGASFDRGVRLHRLPTSSIFYAQKYAEVAVSFAIGGSLAFAAALEELRKQQYDIVHGHGNVSLRLLLSLPKKSKYVFTIHNRTPWMMTSSSSVTQAFRQITFNLLDLRIIEKADRIITVTENLREEIVNRFDVSPSKVNMIPNGVDTRIFRPSVPNSKSIRSKYHIDRDYALFVGRLVEEKAVHTVIKAIAGTKLHLVIVGSGPSLPFLKDLTAHLGLDEQVHFVGPISRNELPKFYAEATVSVLPSATEVGSSLAGLEAMASGLPIVASCASRIPGIVNDGYNGYIVDLSDITQLQRKIVELFEDRSLRKTMGDRSRKTAEKHYSWEQTAKRTLDLYKQMA